MKAERPPPLLRPEDLRQISDLSLVARWIVEGTIAGLHRSPFHGFSIEFAEYREYTKGDDLRYFDWKAYGRSDRSYIKKFHSETNLPCHLILDSSASMAYGEPSKFHYGRCLAAAMAYLLSLQQDSVGLVLLDRGIRTRIPPGLGPAHIQHLHDVLSHAEPASATEMLPALHDLAEAFDRRGVVAIFSDLYGDDDGILDAMRHFRFRGHELIIFHLLHPSELRFDFDHLRDFEDLETGERLTLYGPAIREAYERAVQDWISRYQAACDGCQADYRVVETSEPFAWVLADYLHRRTDRRAIR